MNYQRIYNNIIEHRKNETPIGYTESHHIIPRSLGGTDDKENLVALTAREHYICHYLLLRIHKNTKHFHSMLKAFMMMCMCRSDNQKRVLNSKVFEKYRIEFSKMQSASQLGEKNSQFGMKWYYNESLKISKRFSSTDLIPEGYIPGRKIFNLKESTRLAMSERSKNRVHTEETRKKISLSRTGQKRK